MEGAMLCSKSLSLCNPHLNYCYNF